MNHKKNISDIVEKIEVNGRESIDQLEALQTNYVSIMGEKDPKIEQKV